ncbi:response regulator transcription factor [Corallococcus exiguus]|uniref:LytR/AlgR family response regulator transcription factor n=1 Tax=Corallococcus TaxID=83461 RepID=UPI000ED82C69|nr:MULTISPECIES: LytTR family DNA-binding domain-containing protein [Corallococcus]NNC21573.1 response regulator transcription factor [Corallococcus exiguus]RKI07806.1 DNA-binding response regulator [Corallococcus sp. AB030]RUO90332.1 DNA-binding response regulator [Corallococcus sp. AB018]
MKVLIADDERLARAELRRLLTAFPEVEVVGEATHVDETCERVEALAPDLLLLDIQMPGGTGFDVLDRLEAPPDVVFTTAHDAHALRAFQVNALDYLLKPIEAARLAEALERVRQRGRAQRAVGAPVTPLERVFVRDGERCWLVALSQVPLFSSEGNYARLHLPDAEPLLARSLNHLEDRLDPARFFRASRQHLINLDFVEALEPGPGGTLIARLRGGREVEMSRRQSQRFRERLSP